MLRRRGVQCRIFVASIAAATPLLASAYALGGPPAWVRPLFSGRGGRQVPLNLCSLRCSGAAHTGEEEAGLRALMGISGATKSASPQNAFQPPEGRGDVALEAERLARWVQKCGGINILSITGAGISTESGIPDYRSPKGSYSKGHKPIQHDEFISSDWHRSRYWARSMAGWKPFSKARPNEGHVALAKLEEMGVVSGVITQNVDSLHQAAGSRRVINLHGRNDVCVCMSCGHTMGRAIFHEEMLEPLNDGWVRDAGRGEVNADGDAEVTADFSTFVVPGCPACGDGMLKPDVVFFGDVVPDERKEAAMQAVESASGVLVVGSSLAVLSSFRLVEAAHKLGKPIAIVNIGETRAEKNGFEVLKIEERAGSVLKALLREADA